MNNKFPSLTIIKEPLTDTELFDRFAEPQQSLSKPQQTKVPDQVPSSKPPLTLSVLQERVGNKAEAFTVTDRVDGIGAQALAKISAMVMAEALKCEYVHIPFTHLEHCDQNMKLSAYCERWDEVLQLAPLGQSRPNFPNTHNLCKTDALIQLQCQPFKVGHLYCFRDCHSFTEAFRDDLRDAWKTVILRLRDRLTANANANAFNVAVHIRRGDVSNKDTKRWSSDEYYINIIKRIKADFPAAQFQIVSEGDEADFDIYRKLFDDESVVRLFISPTNTNNRTTKSLIAQPQRAQFVAGASRNQLFLNRRPTLKVAKAPNVSKQAANTTTVFDAFQILVNADILVMSKSTFSYLAALYNGGRKIVPPDMWLSVPKWCEESDFWVNDVKRLF